MKKHLFVTVSAIVALWAAVNSTLAAHEPWQELRATGEAGENWASV